jgi:predicted Zn finger-like uncharacterized protein
MSMITRCPACGTMFKVVPDQLRISEGWVRCGKCAEVFDASQRLEGADIAVAVPQEPAAPPGPLQPSASVQPSAPAQASVAAQATEPAHLAPSEPEGFSSSLHTDIGDDDLPELLDSVHFDEEANALVEHPLDRPFELRRADAGEVTGTRQDKPRRVQPEPEPEDEHEDLSFVRQARSDTARLGPATRVMFLVVLIVLALLLVGQLVIHDRDRLAASDPALARLVANLCVPLSCRAQVPRQIDAIVIDSSSFNRLRGEAYRLNVTLKNQALIEVALPALELTLTDGQEQALVRRVFMPSELGTRPVIAASSDWSGSLALALSDNSGSRIAGYRLLAFYP